MTVSVLPISRDVHVLSWLWWPLNVSVSVPISENVHVPVAMVAVAERRANHPPASAAVAPVTVVMVTVSVGLRGLDSIAFYRTVALDRYHRAAAAPSPPLCVFLPHSTVSLINFLFGRNTIRIQREDDGGGLEAERQRFSGFVSFPRGTEVVKQSEMKFVEEISAEEEVTPYRKRPCSVAAT